MFHFKLSQILCFGNYSLIFCRRSGKQTDDLENDVHVTWNLLLGSLRKVLQGSPTRQSHWQSSSFWLAPYSSSSGPFFCQAPLRWRWAHSNSRQNKCVYINSLTFFCRVKLVFKTYKSHAIWTTLTEAWIPFLGGGCTALVWDYGYLFFTTVDTCLFSLAFFVLFCKTILGVLHKTCRFVIFGGKKSDIYNFFLALCCLRQRFSMFINKASIDGWKGICKPVCFCRKHYF